jgi:predicted RNA polymerase sigma factor
VPKAMEAMWKIESTPLVAAIARVTRDIGIAEELAQDAPVTARELWPEQGIPENPGAWLMTAAKRRAIDSLRRSCRQCGSSPDALHTWSHRPETGLEEINADLREADFWTTSRCLAELMPFEMRRPLVPSTPLLAVRYGTWGRAPLLSR